MDPDVFCREIEAYLCRKNDGHLVRVVGPAFVMVSDWAARGIPPKVAFQGIDRYFERYYGKGPRRRPVRIEFCEADVLDAFDGWRRAVGLALTGPVGAVAEPASGEKAEGTDPDEAPRRHGQSLRSHLDRVVTRLTALQAADIGAPALEAGIVRAIELLAAERDASRSLRGEAREACLGRLESLDAQLMEAARQSAAPETVGALRDEAERELAAFRARMARETYETAVEAATRRLLREHWKLPVVAFDSR